MTNSLNTDTAIEEFKARLHDEAYAAQVAEEINKFIDTTSVTTLSDAVSSPFYRDVVEVVAQYHNRVSEPFVSLSIMFLLGAYLAKQGLVIFPMEVN